MRAALYARFSSDLQNPGSIRDQLAACHRFAERIGATVVAEFQDAAISGASMAGRPGLTDLLAAAKTRAFDVVIAEAYDRLTRSGGDAWDIYEDLKGLGVEIQTISEGKVEELVVGLKGTMNALFLRDLGAKVRRGQEGVVRSGRITSKPPFGYRRKRAYDDKGEPIRGLIEICEEEAAIVRRIVAEYLGGSTGQAIARRLNDEGVPGPRQGHWDVSAVIGRPGSTLRGILRNPMYAGELVWNRQRTVKDRRTGKVRNLDNPPEAWVRHPAPELRLIEPHDWARVQARLAERSAVVAAAGNASAGNAPKRLLTGLAVCGVCAGALHSMGPDRRYRCVNRARKGPAACSNARTAPADQFEAQALVALRRDLLHPEVIETVVREYHAAQARKGSAARARLQAAERELSEVKRRADRLIDQVADGLLTGQAVKEKLAQLEARRLQLESEIAQATGGAQIIPLAPQTAARYRKLVEDLQTRLEAAKGSTAERDAARTALRQVIRQVRLIPGDARGAWSVEIDGDLTALLQRAAQATPAQRRGAAP